MAENNILLRIIWQRGAIFDRTVRCLALNDTSLRTIARSSQRMDEEQRPADVSIGSASRGMWRHLDNQNLLLFLPGGWDMGKSGRQGQQNSATSAFLSPGESCSSRHLRSELANIYPIHGTLHFLFDLTGGPNSPGDALWANGTGQEGEVSSAVRSFYCPQAWVPHQCPIQYHRFIYGHGCPRKGI